MKTNTKISLINIACAFGLGALVWYTKKKCDEPVSGIGAAERIKRRIYKEVSLAQSAGVDFSKRYADLTKAEKKALENVGKQVGWKQSKRSVESGKPYVESYFGSLRRAWNAVSGVSGIGRAYDVKDAQGNVCLTWIEDAAQHVSREKDIEEKRQRALEAEKRAADARKRMKAAQRKIDKDGMLPAAPVAPAAPVVKKPKKQTAQRRKEAGYDERYEFAQMVWDSFAGKNIKEVMQNIDAMPEHASSYAKQFKTKHDLVADGYARKKMRVKPDRYNESRDALEIFIVTDNYPKGTWAKAGEFNDWMVQYAKEILAAEQKAREDAGWGKGEDAINEIRRELLKKAKLMQVAISADGRYKFVTGNIRYDYLSQINYVVMVTDRTVSTGETTNYPIRSYPDKEGAEKFAKLKSGNLTSQGAWSGSDYIVVAHRKAKVYPIWDMPVEKITGISGIGALNVEDGLEPELLAYVRDNVDERRMSLAFDTIDHMRCPLSMAEPELYDDIVSLVEDWCTDNAIDPDSIWELYDPEDIFWAI